MTTYTATYPVFEANFAKFAQRIEAIARRAERNGMPAPAYTSDNRRLGNTPRGEFWMLDITVSGQTPVFAGWELVGMIQHAVGLDAGGATIGNQVHGFGGNQMDAYRHAKPVCDHCNTTRRRSATFVLRHVDTGDLKQVGADCLQDFTGAYDPFAAALAAGMLGDIRGAADDAADLLGVPDTARIWSAARVVAYAAYFIEKYGWRPQSQRGVDAPATADLVREYLAADASVKLLTLTEARVQAAREMMTTVRDALGAKLRLSDFESNLHIAASADAATAELVGILCYIPVQAAKAALPASGGHIGVVGQRVPLSFVVAEVRPLASDYARGGVTYLVRGGSEGRAVVWFSSNKPDFAAGDTVTGKATIKAHDSFNGQPQTVITRFK